MKLIYRSLICLLLLTACGKEEKQPGNEVQNEEVADLSFFNLKGNVKSVSQKSFKTDAEGKIVEAGNENAAEHDIDYEFDENGMLVQESKFTRSGATYSKTSFKNGRQKMQNEIQYINGQPGIITEYVWDLQGKDNTGIIRRNKDQSQISRIEMKYTGGRINEKNTYNKQNNPTDKIVYKYDDAGNLISESQYLNTEYVQVKSVYEYNDKNQKTSESRFKKDSLLYKTVYVYNGDNIASKTTSNPAGEEEYSEKYTYNNEGLVDTYTIFEKNNNTTTVNKYSYDENGNRAQWQITQNGKVENTIIYQYDKENNLSNLRATDAEGKVINNRSYTFEYDEQGNWIKKLIYIDDVPAFAVKRQITYY